MHFPVLHVHPKWKNTAYSTHPTILTACPLSVMRKSISSSQLSFPSCSLVGIVFSPRSRYRVNVYSFHVGVGASSYTQLRSTYLKMNLKITEAVPEIISVSRTLLNMAMLCHLRWTLRTYSYQELKEIIFGTDHRRSRSKIIRKRLIMLTTRSGF
ncbi:unnamed protein product [Fasciola hepatica]|uniref:Uncharacterized protein n=1 Tax=Fasciola hepatica TaxID=6192 RepID=A0ABC9HGX2_FASHE